MSNLHGRSRGLHGHEYARTAYAHGCAGRCRTAAATQELTALAQNIAPGLARALEATIADAEILKDGVCMYEAIVTATQRK